MNIALKNLSDRLVALNATSAPDFIRLVTKYEVDVKQDLRATMAEDGKKFQELNSQSNGAQSFRELLTQGSASAALIGKMFYNSFKLNYGDHNKAAWDQLRNELKINGQLAEAFGNPSPKLEELSSIVMPAFIRQIHNQGLLEAHPGIPVQMTTPGFTQMQVAIAERVPTLMQRVREAYQVLMGQAKTIPVSDGINNYKQGLEQANTNGMRFMGYAAQDMQTMRAQRVAEQPSRPS